MEQDCLNNHNNRQADIVHFKGNPIILLPNTMTLDTDMNGQESEADAAQIILT